MLLSKGRITAPTPALRAVWTGILLSAIGGTLCYIIAASRIDNSASERFSNIVRGVQFTLTGRIKSYADVLRGSASMFQAQPQLTREQFHRYVAGLNIASEFPGIEAINFARYVKNADRPAFEKMMRAEIAGLPQGPRTFQIKPAGEREEYLVLTYIESRSPWAQRLGIDLRARQSVIATLDNSRDTGEVATSGTPIPLQTAVTGIGMRLPVYRADMPTSTVEERRAAYYGSVGIGFSMERLLEGVLESQPIRKMRLVLATGPEPGAANANPVVLYDSARMRGKAGDAAAAAAEDELEMTVPIQFSEHAWHARFSVAKRDVYDGADEWAPAFAATAGFLSIFLLYALYQTLASSRRNALEIAQEMTQGLRASEEKLKRSNETLRRLAAHAESIKESERKRIAREIHDDLGQNLLALRIEAEMLRMRTGTRHRHLHERACRTLSQIDTTIKSVRQIINDLRPNVLDLGLNAAVAWQIADFKRRTGIPCDLVENEREIVASDRCATALFRILQESLANISRHAHASRVEVHLLVKQDCIAMTVADNGVGLSSTAERKPGSFGLIGIEERVKILGGTLMVSSTPGAGTKVAVTVPLIDHGEVVSPPRALNAPEDMPDEAGAEIPS
jgi:signal transduction histidine kinase